MGKTERHRDGAKAQNGSVGAKTEKKGFRNIVIAQGAGSSFHLPKTFLDTKNVFLVLNHKGNNIYKRHFASCGIASLTF